MPRRNHSACTLNKYMLVSGGIDNFDKIISNFQLFDMGKILKKIKKKKKLNL
jgi:hypothetical protein